MTRDPQPAAVPTLAVVVPVLDEAEELPGLLDSLCRPGAPEDGPDDVVIVDGGSRDGTLEVARAAGARTFEATRGRGSQLARGARETSCDVLVFLHADMRLEPGALASVRRAFRSPDVAVAGMRQVIEHPGRVYRTIEAAADRRVRRGWVYGDSGLCIRREVYEAVGGFRTDLPLFEDLDLSRRLRRRVDARLLEDARLRLSPRRWERRGPVRQTIENRLLTLLWALGVHPRRLARFYPSPRATTRPATRTGGEV